jgi:hypothetical protein
MNPSLFGIKNSNRDFSLKDSWGKNQFNSSFPASLCCYMAGKGQKSNWIFLKKGKIELGEIDFKEVFCCEPLDEDLFFAFETPFSPFQKYLIGNIPRTDLVTQSLSKRSCLSAIEIKLTALPDHTTCELNESEYGSELVVRPDTICYLACFLVENSGQELKKLFEKGFSGVRWSNAASVSRIISEIICILEEVAIRAEGNQTPFLVQPIWKTIGKSQKLADFCLDVFTWSSAAFLKFILEISERENDSDHINRQSRTVVWIYLLLSDLIKKTKVNFEAIIDQNAYNTRNDKAFAVSGVISNKYMRCKRLEKPLVNKNEIKSIILGGGQNLLSPERRFDAILAANSDLF